MIKPKITGFFLLFSAALSTEKLMMFRAMIAAQAPTAKPYENRRFGPKAGREISSAIPAAMIVYRIKSLRNLEMIYPSSIF